MMKLDYRMMVSDGTPWCLFAATVVLMLVWSLMEPKLASFRRAANPRPPVRLIRGIAHIIPPTVSIASLVDARAQSTCERRLFTAMALISPTGHRFSSASSATAIRLQRSIIVATD